MNEQAKSAAPEIQIINGSNVMPFHGGRKRFAAALAALAILNRLVAHHSGFTDFTDLLNSGKNYSPTLEVPAAKVGPRVHAEHSLAERKVIADAYDECQRSLKDERRAHRYSPPKRVKKKTYRRKTIQVGEG